MKSLVGIYESHEKAIAGIRLLKENGFTSKHLSLLSKVDGDAEMIDDNKRTKTAVAGLGIGAVAGSTVGLLAGIGLLAIPGLGFLLGAGALAGAVAGFDLGIIGGGLISALAIGGLEKDMETKYQTELEAGKTLFIVQGNSDEIEQAQSLLTTKGGAFEINVH